MPDTPAKRLDVRAYAPNCTGTPRPVGYMSAYFDNVLVNAAALAAGVPRLSPDERADAALGGAESLGSGR